MIQGLIFDFDGLILETEVPIYQSWKELYKDYGQELDPVEWGQVVGLAEDAFDPLAQLEERLERKLDQAVILPRRQQRELELILAESALPGVTELLAEAKRRGLKLAVASSSTCAWVTGHLERLGLLHYFDAIRARDDVENPKPAPDLFLAALQALGLQANQAVIFEDSLNGIIAAKQAGVFVIAVPNEITRLLDLSAADRIVASLAEVDLNDLLKM